MSTPHTTLTAEYQGYATSKGDRIRCEDPDITPSAFFEQYICKRRPVCLKGHLPGTEGEQISKLASLSYLRTTAKSSLVKVEPYNTSTSSFGTALVRKSLPFPTFLDLLQDQSQRGKWYLTTQYDESDSDEEDLNDEGKEPTRDPICPPPTDKLVRTIPRQPSLMGNLVLQQCNLWIGNSADGTSSGLHHDFHDNLYVLLRGRKRFVLFPPSSYPYLHIRGQLARLCANGLLHYRDGDEVNAEDDYDGHDVDLGGEVEYRSDGLTPLDAARWAVLSRRRRVHELEAATIGSQTISSKKSKKLKARTKDSPELVEARAKLEQARKKVELLKAENYTKSNASSEESEDEDDSSPLFGDGATDGESDWDAASAFDEAEALLVGLDGNNSESGKQANSNIASKIGQTTKPEPLSFSHITPAALHAHLGLAQDGTASTDKKKTTKGKGKGKSQANASGRNELVPLPGCPPALVVDLHPGEMLYLPAGWFHEVTSTAEITSGADESTPVHIALNYWFHPPDRSSFTEPYEDREVWAEISRAVEHEWNSLLAQAAATSQVQSVIQNNTTKEAASNLDNDATVSKGESKSAKNTKKRKQDAISSDSSNPPKAENTVANVGVASEKHSKRTRRNPRSRRRHLKWMAAKVMVT